MMKMKPRRLLEFKEAESERRIRVTWGVEDDVVQHNDINQSLQQGHPLRRYLTIHDLLGP